MQYLKKSSHLQCFIISPLNNAASACGLFELIEKELKINKHAYVDIENNLLKSPLRYICRYRLYEIIKTIHPFGKQLINC